MKNFSFWVSGFIVLILVLSAHYRQPLLLHLKASAGNTDAQYRLGRRSDDAGDYTTALKWYRRSAEQDFPWAEVSLGNLYLWGHGVPVDPGQALDWYQKAADQGDSDGEHNLATMYYNGDGVRKLPKRPRSGMRRPQLRAM